MEVFERGRTHITATLENFMCVRNVFQTVPQFSDNDHDPYWHQYWFNSIDAVALVAYLTLNRPRRYIEIGSGNSTKFARWAVAKGDLPTEITSVDPKPRAEINDLCDNVFRQRLQDCDLSIFDALEEGDILFFDGSHRVLSNSDVMVFFLEILPRLRDGVYIHVHDIFLPDDYPPQWGKRFYTEQYMLLPYLMGRTPLIQTILPAYFACVDSALSIIVDQLLGASEGFAGIAKFNPQAKWLAGTSFWGRTNFRSSL